MPNLSSYCKLCPCLFLFLFSYFVCAEDHQATTIDQHADTILKSMGNYLKSADNFTFTVRVALDEVLDTGQKIQYEYKSDVCVRRPSGMQANRIGDQINDRIWYDGKSISIWYPVTNEFTTLAVPDTIDTAFDFLAREYRVTPPVVDFIYSDPYQILIENVVEAKSLGIHTVRGTPCHHLAFVQTNIDWQLWIEDGPRRVPRKIVIAYKNEQSLPQFTAHLSNWDFHPRIAEDMFRFLPPDDAVKIRFEDRHTTKDD